ncbi:D-alanyl-D-alanine carboxypeptidase/D-alanyl-D-alanine endopeptidase [Virgibacillus sp. DJP39]|uniref:D-alanyl-D-alanine carboxypeptidase/D-alanyl-D-alanine endopeptidase n=1 Tax=Virgibacillus sp. DJP39 TaxID=3409790 RepID=UPI003BB73118
MKMVRIIFAILFVFIVVILIDIAPADDKNTVNKVKDVSVFEKPQVTQEPTSNKPTPLKQKIDEYIKSEPNLAGAIIGISIRSAATGEIIYEHSGNTRMHPASNMKLFTGATAMSTLGRDHTFKTEILTDNPVNGTTLQGDLYLKGKGDPTLLPGDLNDFAKKIIDSGVSKINGDIVADDSWFDDIRITPDLIWDDEQYYYGAQISGLTVSPDKDYDAGSVIVEVKPGASEGQKPIISVSPQTNYVQIVNQARTVPKGKEEDIEVEREHGTNVITVKGTIPSGSWPVKEWMAVWEPTRYTLDLFQQALRDQGITWTGDLKVGKAPEQASVFLSHKSAPLSDMILPFMKLSNNVHAEVLVKEMGKAIKGEGSWEKGLEVMEEKILEMGLNIETLKLRDGSGISSISLVPPNEISKLLYTIQKEEWFPTFVHSLPVAGADDRMVGGTLRNRMEDISNFATIQAKTGTINSVSSLSGYINPRESETIIFSIVINHLLDEDGGKDIEDNIVTIIASQ